ncbi:MAG: 30S ribosome-binding factor RbfA [Spirochaetota bacterium]|nr:30S ribosome-binding factor RbfA [Spirochaetota bacterium]
MAGYRKERLEELIKRIIADALLTEVMDPRVGFVTVTMVKLSKDYSTADVFISVIGDERDKRNTMYGLKSAAGFLQYKIAKGIRLKSTPLIKFHLDLGIERGVEMGNILDKIEEERRQNNDNENIDNSSFND